MDLNKFSTLGTFEPKVEENSLVECPECKCWYGVNKWLRSSTSENAVCPGCGTPFVTEQEFATKPAVKLPDPVKEEESEETKPEGAVLIAADGTKTYQELGLKAGSRAKVKTE